MKLLPEFGSCWGGAVISPAAEAAVGVQQTEEYSHRHGHIHRKRLKPRGGGMTHWKPKLNVISEDSPMPEADRGGDNRRTAAIDRKKAVKVKPKSPAPLNHVEDYWKCSQAMVVPAFAPTSFLF